MIPLSNYLVLGAFLFCLSVAGMFINRKNVIILLMCIELMLLAVNMNFIAFSHYLRRYCRPGLRVLHPHRRGSRGGDRAGHTCGAVPQPRDDQRRRSGFDEGVANATCPNDPSRYCSGTAAGFHRDRAGLFGRAIGRAGAHWVTIASVGLSPFCLSLWVFRQVVFEHAPVYNETLYTWMVKSVALRICRWVSLIDSLTAVMMVVVTFVSWMVHVYTIGYMHEDPGYQRFFSYISLFTFSMLMLVMSNNFLQLFFGWEAVGVVSYLLIGFWFKRDSGDIRQSEGVSGQPGGRFRIPARYRLRAHVLRHTGLRTRYVLPKHQPFS